MTTKPTIYAALAAKLGREPTNEEYKAEIRRIMLEAHDHALRERYLRGELVGH